MAARAEIIVFDHFRYLAPCVMVRCRSRRLPVVYLYVPSCPENVAIQICPANSRLYWDGHFRALVKAEAWDLDEYLNNGMNELLLCGHVLLQTYVVAIIYYTHQQINVKSEYMLVHSIIKVQGLRPLTGR